MWGTVKKDMALVNILTMWKQGQFKGAQAWDIRERVFYTNQTCTGRWLGEKNEISQVSVYLKVFGANIFLYLSGTVFKVPKMWVKNGGFICYEDFF